MKVDDCFVSKIVDGLLYILVNASETSFKNLRWSFKGEIYWRSNAAVASYVFMIC